MADGEKKKVGGVHAGHRQRVKEEFLARGLDGVPDHRVLELLLFFTIPQGDVNPLAHTLLERFGTLSGVFDARYEELLEVKGVGPNTAALIHTIPSVARRYLTDRAHLGGQLSSSTDYWHVLAPYFFGVKTEVCYMLCLDGMGKYINCCKLGEGIVDQVSVSQRKVVETALQNNAVQVVLAHNHVSGYAKPSGPDLSYTQFLKKLLLNVDVVLKDHLVIVDQDWVSMADSGSLGE